LDAMQAFVEVAKVSSFTGAAEQLGWSPQLVSKYVSQLEDELGIRLFNRTTRKVSLTEAGRRYELSAKQVLQDIESMENELGNMQHQASGLLRISAPVSFGAGHLAPLLSAFQIAYPEVVIDVQLNDRKVDIVDEGYDLALRIGQLKSSSLIAKKLAPIRLVVCAAPSYLKRFGEPKTLADIADHHVLFYSYSEDDSPMMQALRQANRVMQSNNGDLLTQAAIAGHGITMQPSFIVGDALRKQQLQPLKLDYKPNPI